MSNSDFEFDTKKQQYDKFANRMSIRHDALPQRAAPLRNPLVKNKTGKPMTKPGVMKPNILKPVVSKSIHNFTPRDDDTTEVSLPGSLPEALSTATRLTIKPSQEANLGQSRRSSIAVRNTTLNQQRKKNLAPIDRTPSQENQKADIKTSEIFDGDDDDQDTQNVASHQQQVRETPAPFRSGNLKQPPPKSATTRKNAAYNSQEMPEEPDTPEPQPVKSDEKVQTKYRVSMDERPTASPIPDEQAGTALSMDERPTASPIPDEQAGTALGKIRDRPDASDGKAPKKNLEKSTVRRRSSTKNMEKSTVRRRSSTRVPISMTSGNDNPPVGLRKNFPNMHPNQLPETCLANGNRLSPLNVEVPPLPMAINSEVTVEARPEQEEQIHVATPGEVSLSSERSAWFRRTCREMFEERQRFILPAFGGISVLSFSKAFTFSMFSVPEHYKKHTEELKKKAQDIVKSKTMKDRTRKPSVVKEREIIINKEQSNKMLELSKKLRHKMAEKRKIATYVKKPLPTLREDREDLLSDHASRSRSSLRDRSSVNFEEEESKKSLVHQRISDPILAELFRATGEDLLGPIRSHVQAPDDEGEMGEMSSDDPIDPYNTLYKGYDSDSHEEINASRRQRASILMQVREPVLSSRAASRI